VPFTATEAAGMSKEVRVQIFEFFSTYFSTIRDFIMANADIAAHVPEIFKFPYIVLTLKCPDGYVVAAYPSRIEDNYIYIEQVKAVRDALEMLPNKILGTENHVALGVDQLGGSGRYEAILDRVETSRGPLPTTGWKFLHIATADHQWSAVEARKSAEEFIAIFKARAALYQPGSGGGFIQNYDRIVLRREVVDRLHTILDRYKAVVNEKTFAERVIHRYLRDNPILLYPTKKRLLFEYPLLENGVLRYRIDFIIELTSGRYILVELENPNHQIFTLGQLWHISYRRGKIQLVKRRFRDC
jgi:hypothetical protein